MKKIQSSMSAIALFAAFAAPMPVFAAPPKNIKELIDIVIGILRLLVPLLFALALVAFLYGGFMFIVHAANPVKRKEGGMFLLYGIIGLFVMFSVWGLVGILTSTFGLSPVLPSFPVN